MVRINEGEVSSMMANLLKAWPECCCGARVYFDQREPFAYCENGHTSEWGYDGHGNDWRELQALIEKFIIQFGGDMHEAKLIKLHEKICSHKEKFWELACETVEAIIGPEHKEVFSVSPDRDKQRIIVMEGDTIVTYVTIDALMTPWSNGFTTVVFDLEDKIREFLEKTS